MRLSAIVYFVCVSAASGQARGEEIKLTCDSKFGVEQVAIDTMRRVVQVEELHDYGGSKSHAVLRFQDGQNASAVQRAELNGQPAILARHGGPQRVSVDDDKFVFSGTLYGDVRTYEIDRSSGIMAFRTVDPIAGPVGPFVSRCAAVKVRAF